MLLAATNAHAGEGEGEGKGKGDALSIAWDAPAECPDDSSVRAAIRRWLELTPGTVESAAVTATARVRPGGAGAGGWQLDLTLVTPGSRQQEETLVAERCDSLVDLVALKVALAADPMNLVSGLVSGLERGSHAAPAPSPSPPAFGVRAAAGIGSGLLPGTSWGLAASASLGTRVWRVELGGQLWFSRAATYSQVPGAGAEVDLATSEARGCVLPSVGGVVVPVCAGLELGDMFATGFGVAQTRTSDQLWAALTVGPAVRVHVAGPLSFWIEGQALLALNRPEFHVRNLPLLYKPEPAAIEGWTGLELRLD
jgi:hypothetical protein